MRLFRITAILLFTIFGLSSRGNDSIVARNVKFKVNMSIGVTQNLVPITPNSNWFYYGYWFPRSNENNLIQGSRLYYNLKYKLYKNAMFVFEQNFRYGFQYVDFDGFETSVVDSGIYVLLKPNKKLTTSLRFAIEYSKKINLYQLNLGLGYSINNLGSAFEYRYIDNQGFLQIIKTDYIYHGPTFNVSINRDNSSLGLSVNYIPENFHNFTYFNNVIIPSLYFERRFVLNTNKGDQR